MNFSLHVPQPPEQPPQPASTPVIYVRERVVWEYKEVVRDLDQEGMPDEEALNRLGEEGWELSAAFVHAGRACYLFKRVAG
ncbi:MAG: hypothetical protein R3248_03000 [Candidatus Promineifilaceae bacterium]|nr:hypothetical protein [Candidatus Promineifilaceae bacterium]